MSQKYPAPMQVPVQVPPTDHIRQMQQFHLHKLFDLQSDAEFLPLIPSDPVTTAILMQESSSAAHTQFLPPNQVRDPYRGRRNSGQFLRQHLFGGKRSDYAQYRAGQ